MEIQVREIMGRLGQLKEIRKPYEPLWKDVTDYVLPRRSFWDLDAVPGQKPTVQLYDSSALTELDLLVDGILGNLVSVNLPWIHLLMEDRRLNDQPWVRDWLEEVENVLYGVFERSDFYGAFHEFFQDGASIGTGILLMLDDVAKKGVLFSPRHLKECYIAEGSDGKVDTLFREFKLSNRMFLDTWGDRVSPERREAYKTRPFGKGTVVHAIFPRAERDPSRYDKHNKGWISVYIDADYHQDNILDEGGFDDFPALAWRWRKNSDEWYGRSPATDSISEVKRLNQIGRTTTIAAQLAAEPPLNIPDKMKGQERIIPRGYNYYTDPKALITPISLGQNYPISKDQEAQVREQIKNHFRTKMYNLMEQLEHGPYTATEINARQGEGATLQSPMIGRLNAEGLIPLISRVFHICEKDGLIPPPPPALANGGRIRIEFQGPLAQKTKKFHQAQGVDTAVPFIQAMQQMFPESLDNINGDELMRAGLDAKSVPQKTIRELPEVAQIREIKRAQQQQANEEAIAMEQQKMLAGNANKLNEPLNPDSILAALGTAAGQSDRNPEKAAVGS